MAIILKAFKLFLFGFYIDIFRWYFDREVEKRIDGGEGLTDMFVNKLSQKIYEQNMKFIKLQQEIDIVIANHRNM